MKVLITRKITLKENKVGVFTDFIKWNENGC